MTRIELEHSAQPGSTTGGIQEAIDALPPQGGTIYLRAGIYPLRRSILPRANVNLRGEGAATVLQMPKPFVSALTRSTETNATRVELEEVGPILPGDQIFVYEPPYPGWDDKSAGYNSRFLIITDIDNHAVKGRKIYGDDQRRYRVEKGAIILNQFPAIFLNNAHDVTIDSLAIDGGVDTPLYRGEHPIGDFMLAGIAQCASRRVRLRDLTIRRCLADGICVGSSSSDCMVSGCIVEQCQGIGLHSGGSIHFAQFLGNISRANESGFLFCQGNRNVICANNLIQGNRKSGIWGLNDTDRYCIVTGNNCFENGWHGIEASTSIGNVIQGNVCRNNSKAKPGAYAGICLERHRDNVVTDNLCLDDQESPTQTRGLVEVNPAGANLVGDNHCPAPA
jgi:parallel beta-helix repeat protein